MLSTIVWFLFILFIPLLLWDFISQMSFTQAKGKLRRGMKVWSQLLTPDQRCFLEEMSASIESGKIFILKHNREVIISQARWGSRYDLWYYIGYVNLNISPEQLEFRISWSGFSLLLTVYLAVLLSFLPKFFMGMELNYTVIIPLFAFLWSGAWILFTHYQERALILEILSQVISKKSELINPEKVIVE